MDYQMNKAMGKWFKAPTNAYTGKVRIWGSFYNYKVVDGTPKAGVPLEIIDFTSFELLVQVNKDLKESDVNYIG